jgi:hypothetical protein
MVFPYNEAVNNATHNKKKKAATKEKLSSTLGFRNSKGAATTTSNSTPVYTSSR